MYKVKFYKGDYKPRQEDANADKAVAYVEHHFNSSTSESADYSMVIVGSNASQTSCNWGRWYATAVAKAFDTKVGGDRGIVVGGYNGRGDYNVKYTKMPAILLEPLFVSNPRHAEIVRSDYGQNVLAEILVDSIKRFFPEGGLIAFSVGHKDKTSLPNDRGAPMVGGKYEADYADLVLQKAATLLTSIETLQSERVIKVLQNNKEVFSQAVDEDVQVTWDESRGILRINEG